MSFAHFFSCGKGFYWCSFVFFCLRCFVPSTVKSVTSVLVPTLIFAPSFLTNRQNPRLFAPGDSILFYHTQCCFFNFQRSNVDLNSFHPGKKLVNSSQIWQYIQITFWGRGFQIFCGVVITVKALSFIYLNLICQFFPLQFAPKDLSEFRSISLTILSRF